MTPKTISNPSSLPYCAEGAVVKGTVTFGEDCSVWYNAVIRADRAPIVIGANTNVQDGCILHVEDGFPVEIGSHVTIGHGAIVHGCAVGDGTLIGMGAILLNGCRIGKNSLVAAGALVPQNHTYPDGVLLMGSPAKVRRKLTPEEIAENQKNAEQYVQEAKRQLTRFEFSQE